MSEGNTANPLVSIIVPTYNRADRIIESLRSICNQTYNHIEIIIVDDGSTDNTEKTIMQFVADERTKMPIKYFQITNSGPSAARNFGLTKAGGEWVVFFDSDDFMCSARIAKQVTSISTHKTDSCICGFTDSENKTIYIPFVDERKGVIGSLLYWHIMGSTQCWLFRRKYLIEINGYDNSFKYYEDWLLTFRYLTCYSKVSIVNESLTIFKNDLREDRLSIIIDSEKRIPYIKKYYLYVIKSLVNNPVEKKSLSFAIFRYVAEVTFFYIRQHDKRLARISYSTFSKEVSSLKGFDYLVCQTLFLYHLSKMWVKNIFRHPSKVKARL